MSARSRQRAIDPLLEELATQLNRSDERAGLPAAVDGWLLRALRVLARGGDARITAAALSVLRFPDELGSRWECARRVQVLRELLAARAGTELAEAPERPMSEPTTAAVALSGVTIWLPHLRSPFNCGNILRSAWAFGVERVVMGSLCPSLDHPRLRRAAMGATDALAITVAPGDGQSALPDLPLFALELGGTPISHAALPERAILLAGHEELGVDPLLLQRAQDSGAVVSIPHAGDKLSLNVGVALAVALSHWERACAG